MKKLYLVVFIYLLAISSIFSCSAEQLTLTIPTASWHGANISATFSRSVDTPAPPDGYVLAGVAASDYWNSPNTIAYYIPSDNTIWRCRAYTGTDSAPNSLYYFRADSGTIMFAYRNKSTGLWGDVTSSDGNYNVGGFGAIWCKVPLQVGDGLTISPSSAFPSDLFTMRSISTSDKQSLVEVLYNGTSTTSYSVGFYACTADDYSTWWGASVADLASQSFSELPSLGDDGSQDWYDKFKKLLPVLKRTTRITPTNLSLSRKKSIQTLPSPRVVIGYDSVSQILPAQAVVSWQDWINNSSMGGVYSATDIVIIARIAYTHTDLITGGSITDYYFCSQQFDISSIVSAAFTPDEMVTKTQPYVAPSDVSDLDQLATYLRYLHVNNNANDTIRYNNFVQHLDDNAPLYVLQGLNGWLPSLSSELDSVFSGLFSDFTVPTDDQINELKSDIESSENAYKAKFYWITQIRNEVYFVTTSVVNAGDDPVVFSSHPVVNHDDVVYDYGTIVFFDSTHVDKAIADKVKSVITVFCTLGLLFYIFKTLPSTIGNTPNE